MLSAVALPLDRVPADLIASHDLRRRVHDRRGVLAVQFLAREAERLLPVLLDGRLQVVGWGNRRGESAALP